MGAGLAMAGTADASIVYSGVQNIGVAIDPTVQATATGTFSNTAIPASIDMDGGGADASLGVGFLGYGGPTAAKYLGAGYLGAQGGAAFLGSAGGFPGAANLANSAIVGPGGIFSASLAGRLRTEGVSSTSSVTSGSIGNFVSGATGFVGIRLGSGNFGWIRLRLDDLGLNQPFATLLGGSPVGSGAGYPDRVTVIDWAYENNGGPIHVGDIPAPTPLALLAAGAAGIGALRRRKAEQAKA